jgi:RHS repeat-associated protein
MVSGTADYDVFGAARASSGSPGAFRYTGEQWDSTGLEFLRARYYDAAVGRFTQADAVQPNAPGTQGWNPFAYVANNPTTWADPTGRNAAAAAPTRPVAGGGVSDSTAPYAVAAGVAASGTLEGLGAAIAGALLFLAFVIAGAWVLADIWKDLKEEAERQCDKANDEDLRDCTKWAKGKTKGQKECCESIASQAWRNCRMENSWRPPFPWDDPEICPKDGWYPEEGTRGR